MNNVNDITPNIKSINITKIIEQKLEDKSVTYGDKHAHFKIDNNLAITSSAVELSFYSNQPKKEIHWSSNSTTINPLVSTPTRLLKIIKKKDILKIKFHI